MYYNLKQIRKEHKYTVQQMADMLNISKAFYSQLENGMRRLSYEMSIKISSIFGETPDDIFYDDHIDFLKRKTD